MQTTETFRGLNGTGANHSEDVDEMIARPLDFDSIVDPANWKAPGEYYQTMPAVTRQVVHRVVEADERVREDLRSYYREMVRAGTLLAWKRAEPDYIDAIQRKRLYSGAVVAADATLARYKTMSLVGAQIAVSTVGYQQSTQQFVSNIMHWGTEVPRERNAAQIVEAIRSRKALSDKLPNLFLYALTLYKERQVLLDAYPDAFKIIQGTMFPHEMLAGSGRHHTMQTCLNLLGRLIDDGQYATIVSNDSHDDLLFFGSALRAGEYLVRSTGTEVLDTYLGDGDGAARAHFTSTPIPEYGGKSQLELFREFRDKYGPRVVQGVLRAHRLSPPYVFYCNADRLDEAVHTLLADADNNGARGFPLLIDYADRYCAGAFQASEYVNYMNAEFTRAAGGSGLYQSERQTRD